MNPYGLTKPCPECPFLRGEHAVRGLRPGRVREIADTMLDWNGGMFHCHKTVDYSHDDGDEESEGAGTNTANSVQCAGALIFALKHGAENQMMRIASRLGLFDPARLMADQRSVDSVFDSTREMIAAHRSFSRS